MSVNLSWFIDRIGKTIVKNESTFVTIWDRQAAEYLAETVDLAKKNNIILKYTDMETVIFYHNKDMDGYTSGFIMSLKYPNAKLIGWDYADPVPDFKPLEGKQVFLIDITFPLPALQILGSISKLTVIDHHISFKKQVDALVDEVPSFTYIFDNSKAACELGWKFCFPKLFIPEAIKLIGSYDVWRNTDLEKWNNVILPFKYYMYGTVNSPESFPRNFQYLHINECVKIGQQIMSYEDTMNESICKKNSFERSVYGGLNALCLNYFPFSSETAKSVFNPNKHDLMIGFAFNGTKWTVSLRSIGNTDVSAIAKSRGGGGHKNAAGFEVTNFEDIFK